MREKFLLISPDYPPPFIGGSLVYIHNLIENSNLNFTIFTDLKNRKNSEKIQYKNLALLQILHPQKKFSY